MQYYLCEPDHSAILYPFSQIRTFGELRIGLLKNITRYENYLGHVVDDHQSNTTDEIAVFINAAFIADKQFADAIMQLKVYEALCCQNEIMAICISANQFKGFEFVQYDAVSHKRYEFAVSMLTNPFDIVCLNHAYLAHDILNLDMQDASEMLSIHNNIIGSGKIIAEHGVKISGAFLNTENGPIYLGKNVQIMEGVCIRGPVAILEDAVIKMGATIYGATTIGKKCIVGGEIKNSVFFDYSNKAHHGYIGDSVIGSWCNMGAGTSCSNVKNNTGDIYLWNPLLKKPVHVGGKCGVIMGDHSKTAINTSLNSGTVTGICCNIVKAGFPPKYIPDFTWDVDSAEVYREDKLWEDLHNWMKMKHEILDEKNKHLILHLYKERKNTIQ
jgi:UDP-N-acetylglucosamine diphosphorylase/glucosamine-1-phosphate N-acetyltransferase